LIIGGGRRKSQIAKKQEVEVSPCSHYNKTLRFKTCCTSATIMKFHLLVAAATLLGLDHQVNAWAPSLPSVATRTAPKISRRHRYSSSSVFELYVKTGDVETVEDDKTLAAFQEPKTQILGQPIPYSELTIGVIKETFKGENRVSQTPDSIRTLIKAGITVLVESGGT
jgi:hypothetical protein